MFPLVGIRLNATVIKEVKGPTFPDCFVYCLQDNHCRSVNVRGENHQSGEGCELLPGVHSENPFNLVKDKYFDHFAIMPLNRSMVSDPKYLIVNKNPNFLVISFWMVPELLCTFAPTFDLYY